MTLHYLYERTLSAKAHELIQFDVDSIRQFVSSQHLAAPDTWLVDPDQYEKNGRVLRDSPASRMVAWSSAANVIYATDGCNSCVRKVTSIEDLSTLSGNSDISPALLERLATLIR